MLIGANKGKFSGLTFFLKNTFFFKNRNSRWPVLSVTKTIEINKKLKLKSELKHQRPDGVETQLLLDT